MKRTSLFLALLIAILKFTQAQPALAIFSNSISVLPNTVAYNDTVSITYSVQNTGNANFTGAFIVEYAVNDSFFGTLDSSNANVQIDTGQSVQLIVTNHSITPDIYAIGDNIVVIWPVAIYPNASTTDSGTTHIFVDTSMGTGPSILRKQIKVFYKKGNQGLHIDYGSMISQIKDITCYSILGQQTMKFNYAVNEISFAGNSLQVFLLVIRTTEGETITFKILRI